MFAHSGGRLARSVPCAAMLLALACGHAPHRGPRAWEDASPTVWNFDDPAAPLKALYGPAELTYFDPDGIGWGPERTSFGTAGSFGLPPMPDGEPRVMRFPRTSAREGYTIRHHAHPNGALRAAGRVSNYTLIMDVLWPGNGNSFFQPLYQTDPENSGDAELYVRGMPGDLGINNRYQGEIKPGTWHRVAIVVQAASGTGGVGQLQKFIDGRFVGGHGTNSGGKISRWALGDIFHLFTEEGVSDEGYVAGIAFIDRNLPMEDIARRGGPSAAGALSAGQPPQPRRELRRVHVIAHRGDNCCAPENTLAAIRQAFENGADHIEVDVRPAVSGVPVLMHDETVDRTTDGTGLIAGMTLDRIKTLDAGSWFGPHHVGERVPTLVEALKLASGRGRLVLDVKGYRMGAAIQNALKEAGAGPDAIHLWQNSNDDAAKDFRDHLPEVELLWGAMPESLEPRAFRELKERKVTGFDLPYENITQDFIKAAQSHGLAVSVYTVNSPQEMRQMIELGVDAIETDFPAVLDGLMLPR